MTMNMGREHRKGERKASARVWQGAALAVAALVVNGILASIGKGAGSFVRPVIEILGWVIPVGLFAIAFALVISGVWLIWRLRANFDAARES